MKEDAINELGVLRSNLNEEHYCSYEDTIATQKALERANRVATRDAARLQSKRNISIAAWLITPWVILVGVIALAWFWLIEPAIHYHSLSIACSAHQYAACNELRQY
jgi:hypothetical protein